MKKSSYNIHYTTRIVGDNGNSCFITFPYKKDTYHLASDLISNSFFFSPFRYNAQRPTQLKQKQKILQFDFSKLT